MKPTWDVFFDDRVRKIFTEKKRVIDIGGGLRIDQSKNNRYNKDRAEWVAPLLKNTTYLVVDKVADYNPDIVGDIHDLPFASNSEDAILCIAVLEHVENPIRAMEEMYRVLKPGGYALIYVPFLFYYHAAPGYYKDYWRFTKDILEHLGRDFSSCEIDPVFGAIETWIRLSPLGRWRIMSSMAYYLDRITGKVRSNQVSGYNVFLTK